MREPAHPVKEQNDSKDRVGLGEMKGERRTFMSAVADFTTPESSVFSEQEIAAIAQGSPENKAVWVKATSNHRGLFFRLRPSDLFASAAARLSDAEVEFDETERLLIALERARVITSSNAGCFKFVICADGTTRPRSLRGLRWPVNTALVGQRSCPPSSEAR